MKLKQLNEIGHWAAPKKGERMSPLLYPNQTQEFINWGKKKPKKKAIKEFLCAENKNIEIGFSIAELLELDEIANDYPTLEKMGAQIVDQAREIFKKCGAERDFVIQDIGMNIVFGGTNRLIYSPIRGWYIDRGLCTTKFKSNWDRIEQKEKEPKKLR